MRKEKRRMYDVMKNMIDGKTVVIDHIDKDGKVTFTDGTTANNLAIYRFIKNDTELPTPQEITVQEGKLLLEGQEIETGTLYIEKVLTVSPGKILLIVKSMTEGKKDIFAYHIEEDAFKKVLGPVDEVEKLYENGVTVFATTVKTTHDVEVEDAETGDVKTVEEEGVSQRFFIYKDEIYTKGELAVPVHAFEAKEIDNKIILVARTKERYEEKVNAMGEAFLTVAEKEKGETIVGLVIHTSTMSFEIIEEVTEDKVYIEDLTIHVQTVDEEIKHIEYVHDDRDSLLIITEEGFIYTNNEYANRVAKGKEVVEAAMAHPHLIRLHPGRARNVFELANKAGDIVKVSVTKTKDRGYITEVEA